MKKTFLLLPLIAGLAYVTLSSNSAGYPGNRSGSDGVAANTGCGGAGCHGTARTTATTVNIVVDSAGTIVTHYTPGATYRISLIGANTAVTTALYKFGYQLSTSKASSAAQAGTWVASSLPPTAVINSSTGFAPFDVVCHNSPKDDSVVTGLSIYAVSVNWVAPAHGTGSVKIYGVVNAIDTNGAATSGDKWNYNSVTISELPPASVNDVTAQVSLNTFPNPVSSSLTLQLNNAKTGTYNVHVFDMSGKVMAAQTMDVNGNASSATIDMHSFAAGMYHISVEKDGAVTTQSVIKN